MTLPRLAPKATRDAINEALGGKNAPKSIQDARDKLQGINFEGGEEARSEFMQDLERRATALNVGDADNDMGTVLAKLVDVLNKLANERETKP